MKMFCRAMSCDIRSLEACYAIRARIYLYQGTIYCEKHYLEASHVNQPDPRNLIWDFERGYSGMFPHAMDAATAFKMAGQ